MAKIIPAIDLRDNRCVRLYKGEFEKTTVYKGDPVDIAKSYEEAGVEYLHLVDLDGAVAGEPQHLKMLERIATHTKLKVDFSGGIRKEVNIKSCLDAGANQICLGTVAVRERELVKSWFRAYGAALFILGLDVKGDYVSLAGWKEDTKVFYQDIIEEYIEVGLATLMSTDISRDGTLQGSNQDLYKKILDKNPTLNVIASGGVASTKDIEELKEIGVYGIIIGKALYEGKIKLEEIM